jgi:cardiolipin synthase
MSLEFLERLSWPTHFSWVSLVDVFCALYIVILATRARISLFYILLWGPAAIFIPKATALFLFLFGGRKHSQLAEAKKRINRVAHELSGPVNHAGHRFSVLADREGREAIVALGREIKNAKTRIHLSTYILSADAVGREIVKLLVEKAKEGVEVRLLLDAVGSWGTPTRLCRPLIRAGGKVARFNPVFPMQGKGSANWRNHRKIAIFDSRVAIIGGQNIGLNYMGLRPSRQRFRDCSFLIEGPAVSAMECIFIADWCQSTNESPESFAEVLKIRNPSVGPVNIEVISSGPDCENDPLWERYIQLITEAKSSVTIVTPYFIPDPTLFKRLIHSARMGKKIRIIIPRRSDHILLDFARRWYLRRLKEVGAEIYFFKKDVLHAKLFISDDEKVVVGSANLDMRSFFFNYEIGAQISDKEALRPIHEYIASLIAESSLYSEDLYQRSRTWTGRFLEAISKVLAPLL